MADVVLDGLSHGYPATGIVVSSLCLHVAAGEWFVLLGASGSGKTTTLRLIAGLERPAAGRISIGGRDVTDLPAHRRDTALVFQEETLFPHLTVRENLAFSLRMNGRASAETIRRRVDSAARWLRIEALLDRQPAELSGGERRRVALGRAMVRRPQALLLDEPLASLDAPLKAELLRSLKRWNPDEPTGDQNNTHNAATIYVTHDAAEALAVADRIGVLDRGTWRQIGLPEEVRDRPRDTLVASMVGNPAMNLIAGQGRRDADGLWFEGGGWRWPIAEERRETAALFEPGKPVIAGVRAEWLTVTEIKNQSTRLATRVVDRRPTDGGELIELAPDDAGNEEVNETPLPASPPQTLRLRTLASIERGATKLNVLVDIDRVQYFDAATGMNLEAT